MLRFSVLFLAVASCCSACAVSTADDPGPDFVPTRPADLVLTGARVYTLTWGEPARDGTPADDAPYDADGWRPDANAVAIRGGTLLYVGDAEVARRFVGAETRVIDLGGATVLPGFVDSHMHALELGLTLGEVDLSGLENEAELVAHLVAVARDVPAGEWIVGRAGPGERWNDARPGWDALNAALPDHPVLLKGRHGFVVRGNRRAFELAGIDEESPAPEGGELVRDERGRLTGILTNRATTLLRAALPEVTLAEQERALERALASLAADGYTEVHEAGAGASTIAAARELEAAGRLPIRFYTLLSARDAELVRTWVEAGPKLDGLLTVRAVKAYYDAALGSRGARLLEDYSDRPGHRGTSGSEYGFDEEVVRSAMEAGFQVGVHAIGDAGNREVLDFYARVEAALPETRAGRHRIEHAQVIHPADFPRFGELGVIASMEPPHAVEDMVFAEDRLGPERMRGAYAWRSLREAGARLVFNSDLPQGDHTLFYGLHSAITRQDRKGRPPGGWYPAERMTPEEAVRGYTSWAAWASFREERGGVLRAGFDADVTVIDVDPLTVGETEPSALLTGRVLLTIVDGRIAYAAEGLGAAPR